MRNIETPYENFIALSRYARWQESEGRRETWGETVDRYIDFMQTHLKDNLDYSVDPELLEEVRTAILDRQVMPSMRALMTAGPALARDNIAGFNCAFLGVDSPRAFDEAMYILMCGTGVGFSVESKHVSKLPVVNEWFADSTSIITVEDSKAGWARAFRELLALLWQGQVPVWDVSKVRPAGARLKTFGGRASGPEPLEDLFRFAIRIFKGAAGRKLTPLECHDIMCKIGQVVVVGGVRRSAMISLSDLSDYEMSKAKSGAAWHETDKQRYLSNNSAVYNSKPPIGQFLEEWGKIIESNSGERGLFNLEGNKKKAQEIGRDHTKLEGTNPSLVAGTLVWTDKGILPIEQLEGRSFSVTNLNGGISIAECWLSGESEPVHRLTVQGGHSYQATREHRWPVWNGESFVKKNTLDLKSGDLLPNIERDTLYDGDMFSFEDGVLAGWNLGDGWITERKDGRTQYGFCLYNDDRAGGVGEVLHEAFKSAGIDTSILSLDEINISNKEIRSKMKAMGVSHKSKGLPEAVWRPEVSESFRRGVISSLFSADGNVESGTGRIRLISAHKEMIHDVASLLGFYGFKTSVGHRGGTSSWGKPYEAYVLTILGGQYGRERFLNIFGLIHETKRAELEKSLINRSKHYDYDKEQSRFVEVLSVESEVDSVDVWDISVNDISHAFQIDHCVTGNCGEIILRSNQFCNLSEVVIGPEDTEATLIKKVKIAAILGTWQSTLTNFRYIRKIWRDNSEEERLLGVSLTGIFGNELTNGRKGQYELETTLDHLRVMAHVTNAEWADKLGIQRSAAVTTVKPSGTVAQLVGVSSGIHPWHAEQYVRTVRADNKDPMTLFLKDSGFYWEPDHANPESGSVFYFPKQAPAGAVTRNDLSAVDHLNIWRTYKVHWTDHNPSVTINVREEEWIEVAAWVYENWNDVGGISFLPYSDHVYEQAPYTDATPAEYAEWVEKTPSSIDWAAFPLYEIEDSTTGSQELACVSGDCSIIEIGLVVQELT